MSVFSPKTDETPLSTAATTQSLPQKKLRAVSFREIKSLKEQEAYSISLLGSSGVGKTSLIHKAMTNDFQNNCSPSTGIACTSFYFQNTKDDTIIRLDVNDICGNVLYNTFNDKTLSRTNLVVLVYAVDDKKSFEDLDNWLEQYKKNATAQNCLVHLVANKTDIEEVEVKKAEGKKYYVTGDTLYNRNIFKELPKDIYAVFLPINGLGNNMNMADAVRFAEDCGAKFAVPTHFGMFDNIKPEDFMAENRVIPEVYKKIPI